MYLWDVSPKGLLVQSTRCWAFLVRKLYTIHFQCYDLAFVEMHAWKKFFVSNLYWEWNQFCGKVVVSEARYFPPWTVIFYLFSYETPWTLMYQYRPIFRLVLGSFRNSSFFLQQCDEASHIWTLMLTTKSWFFFFWMSLTFPLQTIFFRRVGLACMSASIFIVLR